MAFVIAAAAAGALAGFIFTKKPGSKTVDKTSVEYQLINKVISDVVNKTIVDTNVTIAAGNKFKFVNTGTVKCNVISYQNITSNSAISVSVKNTTTTDMKNELINQMTNAIENFNKTKQGAFSTSIAVTNNASTIREAVSNVIESSSVESTISNIFELISGINDNKFINRGKWICPNNGTLEFNQTTVLNNIVNSLMNSVMTSNTDSSTDNTDSSDTKNKNDTEQQGAIDAFGGFIKSIGDAIGNIMKGPLLVICIAIVVLAILAFIFRKSISKIAERRTGVSFGSKIKKMINAVKKM
jgi:hypothetical protein